MELYNLINIYADKFIPIFIRVSIILSFIPFIGARMVPIMVRVGFSLALTLLLLPIVNVRVDNPVRAIYEAVFMGMALGLMAKIILGAMDMAAQWMSMEMGLSAAAIFNPQFGEILGPVSLFYSMLAMGLFFILDIHHYFIGGIVLSFGMSNVQYNGIFQSILKLNSLLFPLAFKIAAPVMLVQVLVNLGMGFLSRALPQANMFFISMPLLIGLGLFFMTLSLPFTFTVMTNAFTHLKDAIMVFTR